MNASSCLREAPRLLMEGALGERLKREYSLVFDPDVAMAALIYDDAGRKALRALWLQYAAIADRHALTLLAATPTRRANAERVKKSRWPGSIVQDNVRFLRETCTEARGKVFAGGLMGCRGDAYTGEGALTEAEAERFHNWQAEEFAAAGADYLYAGLMPCVPELVGMARAMAATGLPYLLSMTIRADGCLIDGTPIAEAIARVDSAVAVPPAGYMTNCVHPSIARRALERPFNRTRLVRERFIGIQGNTSPLSYEELDGSKALQTAEPQAWAGEMAALARTFGLRVLGGCCGTDASHMEALAARIGRFPLVGPPGRRENDMAAGDVTQEQKDTTGGQSDERAGI